jgi:hypothetical protein
MRVVARGPAGVGVMSLDRLLWSLVVGVIALVIAESVLPRLLPSVVVIFALIVAGRGVWYFTRR